MIEKKNPFYERLKKYMDKEVTVVLKSGNSVKGKLVAINFITLNFIIEGKIEDYIIRDDVSVITVNRGG